jgi:branched-chain amino acid transport system ATP-binding protein
MNGVTEKSRRRNQGSPLLSVQGLTFGVNGTAILDGTTFAVQPGETLGIIGPNGSGKTTLFNCISGFCLPQDGQIFFRGETITHHPPFQRARAGLGRVFQNFGVFRDMTVVENMILALESGQSFWRNFFPWGDGARKLHAEAMRHLSEVGLDIKSKERAGSLSGGQMRLLEIMRAVALGAAVLLLDEPTAGVSPKMKDTISELIIKLQKRGKTILVIEHDIGFIETFCQRVLVLDSGRVVLDDTPDRVRTNEMLHEIYFGASNG